MCGETEKNKDNVHLLCNFIETQRDIIKVNWKESICI